MCVRNKTSYGCGHVYKTTDDCYSSRCTGLDRYHYMKSGDCRSCKTGGEMVTRGREGKGRYAQQMSRRSSDAKERDDPPSTALELDVSGGASPWAPLPTRSEKDWQSPTRKQADDAWQKEHEKRIEDLQLRKQKLGGSVPSSPRPVRHESPERNLDDNSDHYYSDSSQRRRDTTAKALQQEIHSINGSHPPRSRRSDAHSVRHDSYESFDSAPYSVRSTPRRPAAPTSRSYDYHEQHDSGYGSYSSHKSLIPRREHTYSHPSHVYEVPVSSAGYPASYSKGGFGVEIFPRPSPQPRIISRRGW